MDQATYWKHIEKTPSCWIWKGKLDEKGYGKTRVLGTIPTLKTHRIAYFLHYGPFELSKHVLHICDNRACVNPEHLWLGTHRENMKDCFDKGRVHRILSPEQLQEIIQQQDTPLAELAKKYGVSKTHICKIQRGHKGANPHPRKSRYDLLSTEQVAAIKDSDLSSLKLSQQFGVSRSLISKIKRGKGVKYDHV